MDHDVVHISSAEAIRDIAAILDRVEKGAEVIVEKDQRAVALIQPAPKPGRLLSECMALAKAHEQPLGYAPTLDDDFGRDMEEVVFGRRESLNSRWDSSVTNPYNELQSEPQPNRTIGNDPDNRPS